MDYKVVYSIRKTVAIHILSNGNIEVRAPLKTHDKLISDFVKEKHDWIIKSKERIARNEENKDRIILDFGIGFPVFGKHCPIIPVEGKKATFNGESFYIPKQASKEQIKNIITNLCIKVAKDYLIEKTIKTSKKMGCDVSNVKVNSAGTRWGSCSGKNSINFSWRLIAAEPQCIEYVIIHELCHTKEHNHSAKFWAEVNTHMPDYKIYKKSLKNTQQKLQEIMI